MPQTDKNEVLRSIDSSFHSNWGGASAFIALESAIPKQFPFQTVLNMGTPAHRRLMKDFKELQSSSAVDGISAAPDTFNLLVWRATICGPMDTHWEGGIFNVTLTFEHDYPATPPKVRFLTQIYHPNGTGVELKCIKPVDASYWITNVNLPLMGSESQYTPMEVCA